MQFMGRMKQKLYEKKEEFPKSAIERALAYHSLFVDVSNAPEKDLISLWLPSPIGYYKLNVDGALFFDHHTTGIRAILRNNMGNVIWVATIRENHINQLEIVECLAILRGLQLCLHLGFPNLLIESDC